MMKVFECKAMGDLVYIRAKDLEEAKQKLTANMGEIPASILKWKEIKALPKGEEFLYDGP